MSSTKPCLQRSSSTPPKCGCGGGGLPAGSKAKGFTVPHCEPMNVCIFAGSGTAVCDCSEATQASQLATARWKRSRAWTGGRGVSRRIAERASSSHCRATECGGRVVEVVELVNVVVVGAGGRGRHWHRASHWLV